jgi:GNAT superfamily N-acetyltransferase
VDADVPQRARLGGLSTVMSFSRMRASDIPVAEDLFLAFLESDPHYRDVASVYGDGGPQALRSALEMFVEHPELGFVWIARQGEDVVGCCVVAFAISTSRGGLVAKLDDVNVRPGLEGRGLGGAMMEALKEELRRAGVSRIDTATHFDNPRARRFYERHGFASLREERMSCLL